MKHKIPATVLIIAVFSLLIWSFLYRTGATAVQAAGTLYVDGDSSCVSNCGGSWATAYPTLQDALATAASGDQIWVAAGIYYPDEGNGQTNDDRSSTFTLASGVAIYGGFAGTEAALDARDIAANPTVLSGDIDQNDTANSDGVVVDPANITGNNAYHVVMGSGVDDTAVLDGFIITAGQANSTNAPDNNGGGLYSLNGSPTLNNLTFSGNVASLLGGGIHFDGGSGSVTASNLANNQAGRGGGLSTSNGSTATLANLIIENNSVTDSYGGGMYNSDSDPTLDEVIIRNNAGGRGGGLANLSSEPVLTNVTLENNSATLYGGGIFNSGGSHITLTQADIISNTASYGGGMYNSTSFPTLSLVIFTDNTSSAYGGGLYNISSDPELTNVLFHNNGGSTTTQGGGLYNQQSSPTLRNVTFSQNNASDYGGGMRNNDSSPWLENVTFSGNSADSYGGGMYNVNSFPTVVNSTFSGNSASFGGGGIYNFSGSSTLTNVIIANSTSGGDCANNDVAGGSINATSSFNLIEETGTLACDLVNGSNSNIIGQDPNLGSLQNNGGPLETHDLLAGSPAINAGDNNACPATDQRGVTRPQPVTGQCDIGAVEQDLAAPSVTSISRLDDNPTQAQSVSFQIVFNEAMGTVEATDFAVTTTGTLSGTAVTGVSGSGTTYAVTVTIGSGGGTLALTIPAGANITDVAGNNLAGLPFNSTTVYNILGIHTFIPVIVTE